MLWKATALFLIGFMSFGGSASAVSIDAVKISDPTAGCINVTTSTIKTVTFDLTVAPNTAIVMSTNSAGTGGFYPFFGAVTISVLRIDQTTATQYIGTPGSICNNYSMGAPEISSLFKPGLNTVTVTLQGHWSGAWYYAWSPNPIYFVATTGHIVSAQI